MNADLNEREVNLLLGPQISIEGRKLFFRFIYFKFYVPELFFFLHVCIFPDLDLF